MFLIQLLIAVILVLWLVILISKRKFLTLAFIFLALAPISYFIDHSALLALLDLWLAGSYLYFYFSDKKSAIK